MAEQRVVLFIDAENVSEAAASAIVEEAGRHGTLMARRAYGDFSRVGLAPWLKIAPRHALLPCQTACGGTRKNGADIALVIDVMEMLHDGEADVFCLASSDGDFTQLAMRIRQRGKKVVGIGRPDAASHFQAACDVFTAIEVAKIQKKSAVAPSPPVAKVPVCGTTPVRKTLEADILQEAFRSASQLKGGWATLHDVMKELKCRRPGFAVKSYGHSQLSGLLAFSGVELADSNRKARLNPVLKKVVDNG